ncbi:MAG: diadenosine tetraphosphate (Ap4A) HIT family hydrolase [Alphaproteobacteria bacterium]|jgi:diadenosine tetraphosphate (Ap4A) HIT family hydrolase
MIPTYDDDNIFAKILRKQIPSNMVYENDDAYAFHDIVPQAPIHILVIPKGRYVSYEDFYLKASLTQIKAFQECINSVIQMQKIGEQENGAGFRIISNIGMDGGQEVPHFHVHILGGHKLGAMIGNH